MSLYDRSIKINNPNLIKDDASNNGASSVNKSSFSKLRKQVQAIVTPDALAEYMVSNPRKARAEVINAANHCLASDSWTNLDDNNKKELITQLLDYMFGYGPIETLLEDPEITEIMVNGDKSIYFEKGGKLFRFRQKFSDNNQVLALVDRILGPLGRRIDESSPMVNARLSSGHRVHAIIPPLSLDGTVLTIRKFAEHVITLEEMEEMGSFGCDVKTFFTWAILMRKNIAVSGGTGSGKTTLLNAMSCKISHDERVITIEDSAELRFLDHPHVVRLEARPKNAEGKGEITIRELVINALRMRPDRIVVGECRGAEALDMLQAMNTGHDGSLTTLHANSPTETISRLATMVRYAVELPVDVIENYIASAIDLVIQTCRGQDGSRYVSDIVSFSFDKNSRRCVTHKIYRKGPFDKSGKWFNCPSWINEIPNYKIATKEEVQLWKNSVSCD